MHSDHSETFGDINVNGNTVRIPAMGGTGEIK